MSDEKFQAPERHIQQHTAHGLKLKNSRTGKTETVSLDASDRRLNRHATGSYRLARGLGRVGIQITARRLQRFAPSGKKRLQFSKEVSALRQEDNKSATGSRTRLRFEGDRRHQSMR